jgi:hypothetical protein
VKGGRVVVVVGKVVVIVLVVVVDPEKVAFREKFLPVIAVPE